MIESIEIGAGALNMIGWVFLAAFSAYMLAQIGGALRGGERSTMGLSQAAISETFRDTRVIVGTSVAAVVAIAGIVLQPINFGAAIAGLTGAIAPVWFWFVGALTSVTNISGLTDFGIVQVVALMSVFGVGAYLIRSSPDQLAVRAAISVVVFAGAMMFLGATPNAFVTGDVGTVEMVSVGAFFIAALVPFSRAMGGYDD